MFNKKIYYILILLLIYFINLNIFPDESNNSTIINTKLKLILNTPEYRLTPGDRFVLEYSNNTEYLFVDSNYELRSRSFGIINTKELSLNSLKEIIDEKLKINLGRNTIYKFEMIDYGIYNIMIRGEVKQTKFIKGCGINRLDYYYSLSNKTNYSSIRDIIVIRNKEKLIFDLFLYYHLGDISQNPIILPGDIIEFSQKKREVKISGEVKRPGFYELKEEENFLDLLEFANGFTKNAYLNKAKINIHDIENNENNIKHINLKDNTDYTPQHLDEIYIYNKSIVQPVVFIEGAFYFIKNTDDTTDINLIENDEEDNKISLKFTKGEKLLDIIHKLNGFYYNADIENAYIVRGPDNVKIFKINLFDLLYKNDLENNIEILNLDKIVIPSKKSNVAVMGMIKNPQFYPYKRNMNAAYYIQKAGGVVPINGNNSFFWITKKGSVKPQKILMSKAETTIINEGDKIEIRPSGIYWSNSVFPTINSFIGLTISSSNLVISIADFYYRTTN